MIGQSKNSVSGNGARLINKLQIMEVFEKSTLTERLVYSLKFYISQHQAKGFLFSQSIGDSIIRYFSKRMRQDLPKWDYTGYKTIIDILDDFIRSPAACQNYSHFATASKLLQLTCGPFGPIIERQKEPFSALTIDPYWLDSFSRINSQSLIKEGQNKVNFKFLSLQKKTKKGIIQKTTEHGEGYLIKDLLLGQLRTNKDLISYKSLGKTILNTLLLEKNTLEIEQTMINRVNAGSVVTLGELKKMLS